MLRGVRGDCAGAGSEQGREGANGKGVGAAEGRCVGQPEGYGGHQGKGGVHSPEESGGQPAPAQGKGGGDCAGAGAGGGLCGPRRILCCRAPSLCIRVSSTTHTNRCSHTTHSWVLALLANKCHLDDRARKVIAGISPHNVPRCLLLWTHLCLQPSLTQALFCPSMCTNSFPRPKQSSTRCILLMTTTTMMMRRRMMMALTLTHPTKLLYTAAYPLGC